jgi:two-component system, chemotaxis family, sensor kinase CheA
VNAEDELLAVFTAEVGEQLEVLATRLDSPHSAWDLDELFRLAHNVKGAARMVEARVLQNVAHALEDLMGVLRDGTVASDRHIELARDGYRLLDATFLSFSTGLPAPDVIPYAAAVAALLGQPASREGELPEQAAEIDLEGEPPVQESPVEKTSGGAETLRVGVDKVDKLMGLASEFVSNVQHTYAQRQLAGALEDHLVALQGKAAGAADGTFQEAVRLAKQLRLNLQQDLFRGEQLSDNLQDSIRTLRMVRIDSLRTLFSRVVRDAARTLSREAELHISGGDTEIDRMVLESVRDPLVHLLRNAVAHGIERPEERAAMGKPAKGRVTLSARSTGAWVEVRLVDDGRGVDPAKVIAKARRDGHLDAAHTTNVEPAAVLDLLFLPGFSTSESVGEIAGRGVGLDVVRRNATALGGSVRIESIPLAGTTFTLRLPLTRLTTKGIVVRLSKQLLAVPILNVERTILVRREDIQIAEGRDVVAINGQPVAAFALEGVLAMDADREDERPGLVLTEGTHRRVFLVDEILGEREFIIQPLSWNLHHVPGITGATVLDGGTVTPLLNAGELLATERLAIAVASVKDDQHGRRRILIVDDSVTSRTLERNILTSAGYEVIVATDGEEAWEALQAESVDLVVSDVEMPRCNGLELTRRIRASSRFQKLPVVLVTSLANQTHRYEGAQAGANAYIVKGAFDQDQLLESVGRLL